MRQCLPPRLCLSFRLLCLFVYLVGCFVVSLCLFVVSPCAATSHSAALCHIVSRRCFLSCHHVSSCCLRRAHFVIVFLHCISTLHPVVTSPCACRHCIMSRLCDASRPVELFCRRVMFILLLCYLSQHFDLHPCYTTSTSTPSLLIFCRHICRRSPTPPLPSTVAQRASQNAGAMPSHLPTPPPHRLFECCVLIHLQK